MYAMFCKSASPHMKLLRSTSIHGRCHSPLFGRIVALLSFFERYRWSTNPWTMENDLCCFFCTVCNPSHGDLYYPTSGYELAGTGHGPSGITGHWPPGTMHQASDSTRYARRRGPGQSTGHIRHATLVTEPCSHSTRHWAWATGDQFGALGGHFGALWG